MDLLLLQIGLSIHFRPDPGRAIQMEHENVTFLLLRGFMCVDLFLCKYPWPSRHSCNPTPGHLLRLCRVDRIRCRM